MQKPMSIKLAQLLLLFKMALIFMLAGILFFTFSSDTAVGLTKILQDQLGDLFLATDLNTLDRLDATSLPRLFGQLTFPFLIALLSFTFIQKRMVKASYILLGLQVILALRSMPSLVFSITVLVLTMSTLQSKAYFKLASPAKKG